MNERDAYLQGWAEAVYLVRTAGLTFAASELGLMLAFEYGDELPEGLAALVPENGSFSVGAER